MPLGIAPRNRAVDKMQDPEEQLGFALGDDSPTASYAPNLEHIREDLNRLLTEARSATAQSPWDQRTFRYNRIVFVQMSRWLPEAEAEQFCFEFAQEAERIERLLAA